MHGSIDKPDLPHLAFLLTVNFCKVNYYNRVIIDSLGYVSVFWIETLHQQALNLITPHSAFCKMSGTVNISRKLTQIHFSSISEGQLKCNIKVLIT